MTRPGYSEGAEGRQEARYNTQPLVELFICRRPSRCGMTGRGCTADPQSGAAPWVIIDRVGISIHGFLKRR